MTAYKDAAAMKASPWLPQPRGPRGTTAAAAAAAPRPEAALAEALLACAQNSANGLSAIAPPMVLLGAALLDAGGVKGSATHFTPEGGPAGCLRRVSSWHARRGRGCPDRRP